MPFSWLIIITCFLNEDSCYPEPFLVSSGCCPSPSLVLPSRCSEKKEKFGLQARNLGVQSPSSLLHVCVVQKADMLLHLVFDRDALPRKKAQDHCKCSVVRIVRRKCVL